MEKIDFPPYFSMSSLYLAPTSSMASAKFTRTQPGSSSPLGLGRFMV